MHEKTQPQVVAHERRHVRLQPRARPQPGEHLAGELRPQGVVPDEGDAPVRWTHLARQRLGGIVQQRTPAQRAPTGQPVGQRLREQRRQFPAALAPHQHRGVPLQRDRLGEHLERVVVHVEVVEATLLDVPQRVDLGEHDGSGAHLPHQLQAVHSAGGVEDAAQLHEHALAGDCAQPCSTCVRASARVAASGSKSSSTASRTRRSTLRGSWANARGPATRRHRWARSPTPPNGSTTAAPASAGPGATARPGAQARAGARLAERLGDRVDGEVPQREILLQRIAAQPLHVDLPGAVAGDHAPTPVLLGERERGGPADRSSAGRAGDRTSRSAGVAVEHQVVVPGVPAEQAVAHGAAHQPRRPAGERGADQLEEVIRRRQVAPPRRHCDARGRPARSARR